MHHTTVIGSSTAPLLSACSGSFSCTQDGSSSVTSTDLTQADDGSCHAGKLTLTDTADADGGSTKEVIDENGSEVATWSGDSASFELCTSDGCLTCTNDAKTAGAAPSSSSSSGGSGGKCSGITYCSNYGAGDCSSHEGCSLDSHAHYFNGEVEYYDNDCTGSTPDCSSWDTKSECSHQGCTWKE